MSGPAVLFSQMDSPPGREHEFHDWYDTEHIPDRLVLPGFVAASRYEVVRGEPRWLVVYETIDLSAFEHPEYSRLKTDPSDRTREMLGAVTGFTRFLCVEQRTVGDAGPHGHLGVEAFTVSAESVDGFEAGHDERLQRFKDTPGSGRVRRYQVVDGAGAPWTHLVLHELASAEAWEPQDAAGSWLYRCRSRQEASTGRPATE